MGLSWPFNANAKAATSVTVDANGCVLHPACVREKMLSSKRYFTVPPALRKGLNDSSTAFPFSSPVPFPHRAPPDSTLMSRSSLFDSVASVVCCLFWGVAVEKGCVHVTKRLLSVITMEGRNKFPKWHTHTHVAFISPSAMVRRWSDPPDAPSCCLNPDQEFWPCGCLCVRGKCG